MKRALSSESSDFGREAESGVGESTCADLLGGARSSSSFCVSALPVMTAPHREQWVESRRSSF